MRYSEFSKKINEAIPLLGKLAANTIKSAVAKTVVGPPIRNFDKKNKTVPVDDRTQFKMQDQSANSQEPETRQVIQAPPTQLPQIGSEINLPDKETNKMTPFLVKKVQGPDVMLEPNIRQSPNQPAVTIKVNQQDLLKTLKSIDDTKRMR
jgi:hypothetical protein